MIIIGIDPSLTSTGLCVMSKQGELLETYAVNSRFNGVKRLQDIKNKLVEKCCHNHNAIDKAITVFIEGYSYGSKNGREELGELGGVIRLMLYEQKIPFIDIAPTSLKKYTTGKGMGDKVAMAIGVLKSWGKDFPTTDQTDAYALCQFGRGYLGLVDALPVFREEAIDAIKNPKVKKRTKATQK